MGARKPAPAGPVPAHLPLQQWPQPGPADPEGREKGWCSPTPVKPPPQGLGRHLPGFLHETSCSGPSPGRGEPSSKLRPFSAWLSGLSGSELEGEVAPRSSRAARAGPLAAQQAVPRNLGDQREGRRGPVGLCWTQACAKCRLPGQQERSLGEGVSNWSVGGV